jgi:quercetin dioxygenase-like cupin family protein
MKTSIGNQWHRLPSQAVTTPKLLVLCLIVVIALIGQSRVTSAQTPPPPRTVSTVTHNSVNVPAQVDVIQEVIDFAPGAWTSLLVRGGDLFVTVAEGQITLRRGHANYYYSAASTNRTFRVNRGDIHALGNENGAAKARIYTSTLLPPGASLSTQQSETSPAGPAPVVVMTSRATSPLPAGLVSVVQVVWDFDPGGATPPHAHHGFFLVTVVDGELGRMTLADGREQIYRTGEAFTEATGHEWDAVVRNASERVTRNFFTVLATQLPPSTTLPTAAGPIAPPRTGDGGLTGGNRLATPLGAMLLLAVLGSAVAMPLILSRKG